METECDHQPVMGTPVELPYDAPNGVYCMKCKALLATFGTEATFNPTWFATLTTLTTSFGVHSYFMR